MYTNHMPTTFSANTDQRYLETEIGWLVLALHKNLVPVLSHFSTMIPCSALIPDSMRTDAVLV